MKSSLVVFEGIDGSGKTTQIELLKKYLDSQGVRWEVISFPRYEDNIYGELIKRYLAGEFGGIDQVNPYLMALAYAGDRAMAKPLMESWLNSGKLVIANRYVSSSMAHLGANLAEDQREEFMRWLDNLEYETNGLPKPDLVILLDVDPAVGQKNVEGRDIHENNLKHLEQASKIYLELSQAEPNWQVVNCTISGKMKSKEDIHREITALIDEKLV